MLALRALVFTLATGRQLEAVEGHRSRFLATPVSNVAPKPEAESGGTAERPKTIESNKNIIHRLFKKVHELLSHQGQPVWKRPPQQHAPSVDKKRVAAAKTSAVKPLESERHADEKFSIVMQGYSPLRIPNYKRILNEYGKMKDDIDKIVIVWNNKKADPPSVPKNLPVEVVVLRASANHITNRYNVSQELRTDGVLSVDDDVLLAPALMRCMFQRWREDPTRLIGVDQDIRSISPTGHYAMPRRGGSYSVVLTKSMFYDSRYMKTFFSDPIISSEVDTMMTGEDISMNALVSHITGNSPLAVKLDPIHSRKDLNRAGGLEFKPREPQLRTKFSQMMLEHFGDDVFRSTREVAQCNDNL
jgi:hypothetical protein